MKPELLAPAGGFEQLEYAIRFGADAVYLATDKFGMRKRAANFTLAEIPGVVRYAHERGVKVHVTCNTVIRESETEVLVEYLTKLEESGVDALIIGDLGALALARTHAPDVAIHVSTQASVMNAEAALVWYRLGARRIVCAREMSLEDIAHMRRVLPEDIEIEAFVHGAMCMAYSGRCLISDYLTGRSALEGYCTQPCRWNYVLEERKRQGEYYPIVEDENGTYIFNAQDLNMIEHVKELEEAGVDSLRIEGRNKKAFYVATVVNAYRQVLDGADVEPFARELDTVSHRPYSTGFYFGPAHQATATAERDQSCELAGIIVRVLDTREGAFRAIIRTRNAFTLDDLLEVLSPGRPVRRVELMGMAYLTDDLDVRPYLHEPVTRAYKTMEYYLIVTDVQLCEGDLVRKRLVEG